MNRLRQVDILSFTSMFNGAIYLFPISFVVLFAIMTACAEKPGNHSSNNTENSSRISWSEPVQVAHGNGIRGPWRMNQSNFQYVDDPSANILPDGSVGIAWVDQDRQDILYQRFNSNGDPLFDQPVNVSNTPDVFSWFPRVIVTPGDPGHVYVLWQEIVFSGGSHGGEAFFARSTDGGQTFDEPVNLSKSKAGDGKGRLTKKRWDNGSLDLVRGKDGTLYAAWTEYEGRLWFRWSTDQGETFSEPLLIAGDTESKPARGPSLAEGMDGTIHVVWTVGETEDADIHLATVDPADRSLEKHGVVRNTNGHSDAPKIVLDSEGTKHVVWGESPSGPFGPARILYSSATEGEWSFQPPRPISGNHVEKYASVHYPSLGIDGSDRLYVTWELFSEAGRRPKRLGITVSDDRGQSFEKPAFIPNTRAPDDGFNGSQQGMLMGKLSVNENGTLCVVNSNFVRGDQSRVYYITGDLGK